MPSDACELLHHFLSVRRNVCGGGKGVVLRATSAGHVRATANVVKSVGGGAAKNVGTERGRADGEGFAPRVRKEAAKKGRRFVGRSVGPCVCRFEFFWEIGRYSDEQ